MLVLEKLKDKKMGSIKLSKPDFLLLKNSKSLQNKLLQLRVSIKPRLLMVSQLEKSKL